MFFFINIIEAEYIKHNHTYFIKKKIIKHRFALRNWLRLWVKFINLLFNNRNRMVKKTLSSRKNFTTSFGYIFGLVISNPSQSCSV